MIAALLLALTLTPLHGTVVSAVSSHSAVVRIDEIPGTLTAQTTRLELNPPFTLRRGDGVDGFLDRSTRPWKRKIRPHASCRQAICASTST